MTFNPALPTTRDRLRLRLGDIDTTAELLTDATYDGLLAYYGNEPAALKAAAQALIALHGQKPTQASLGDGVSFTWGERLKVWREIVTDAGGGSFALTLVRSSSTTDEYRG